MLLLTPSPCLPNALLASEYDGDYANNRLLGQEQNMSHF
jgi:hypothetical protein